MQMHLILIKKEVYFIMENNSNSKKQAILICAVVMVCIGLLGTFFTLSTINESERAFQISNQIFRTFRDYLREVDPDSAGLLVRPAREFILPLSTQVIVTLSVLVVSVLLLFIGGGLLITRYSNKEKLEKIQQSNISLLTFSALCIALAVVLSQIRLFQMPQGGSVTAFSMLPIVLVGYWYGTKAGISAGIVYGLLRLMIGATVIHPVQFILDYPLAYAALGAFCLFKGKRFGLQISFLAGVIGRFLCSFIGGVIFFGEFAPAGQPVWIYSAIYNISYIAPEAVITLIILSVPTVSNAIEQLRVMRLKGSS